MRRKSKFQRKENVNREDKKLEQELHKLGLKPLPDVMEVNLFQELPGAGLQVIHITSPHGALPFSAQKCRDKQCFFLLFEAYFAVTFAW